MFNCGMLAIELPEADIDKLFQYKGGDCHIDIDFEMNSLTISSGSGSSVFPYQISEFDKALVKAGGWVEFADAKY
jgi:3-isopropylmalate/(R)-2-methylmalate dehydratase small subunit